MYVYVFRTMNMFADLAAAFSRYLILVACVSARAVSELSASSCVTSIAFVVPSFLSSSVLAISAASSADAASSSLARAFTWSAVRR